MKFSEQWLREWTNPPISTSALVEQLTLAGLEVDRSYPVAPQFTNVVIGKVLEVQPHPDADRLRVCTVEVDESEPLNIVCGAQNVRKDLKVAVAKIDAILPNDFKIKKSKIRGVESQGMLCSESELGLSETSLGIMELPEEAPIGKDIREYLSLNDCIIDIELTPNRGDCLSILGIAREVAALNKLVMPPQKKFLSNSTLLEKIPITIAAKAACHHYVGRVIRHINAKAVTPLWMKEKLRRSDIRSISPIVDITNYVLLELGQPLHAFDLDYVQKGIEVRQATENETIHLLDNEELKLSQTDLVITSDGKPIALAGIKGGSDSGITDVTQNIFLESALFDPVVIAKTTRKFGLFTDSSHRFERGVDYHLQILAIERASELILEIAGGELAEIQEVGQPYLERPPILLRKERISDILGIKLSDLEIKDILESLGMTLDPADKGWYVTSPSYRYDINIEIDLIEELARIHGYHNIPEQKLPAELCFIPVTEKKLDLQQIKNILVARGYQEAITYSFVDPLYERGLALQPQPLELINPIASDLSVMRTNLWPGLLKTYQYNFHRQQPRVRLFEMGLCFINENQAVSQKLKLGGLSSGPLYKEQWGETKRSVDFFDIKADLEAVLSLARQLDVKFVPYEHPALHPGKSASIIHRQKIIGCLGELHPTLAQEFDINQSLYLFDLDLESIMDLSLPAYEAISKFPAIRRDVALVVAADVPAEKIREKILDSGGELLKNVQIFDIYQGKGIEAGKKSIALSLIFQHVSRTLVDTEINDFMQKIIEMLHKVFNATLRD